jgi:hypothetical protein
MMILAVIFVVAIGIVVGIWVEADVLMSSLPQPIGVTGNAASAATLSGGAKLRDVLVQEVAKSGLQLAVVVVLGAIVKMLMDRRSELRKEEEAFSDLRKEVTRRLQEIEGQVETACMLLLTRVSIESHGKQMQVLSKSGQELAQVINDIGLADKVFGDRGPDLIRALRKIVDVLDSLKTEWSMAAETLHKTVRENREEEAIARIPDRQPTLWKFIQVQGGGSFQETYLRPHQEVLANIRYVEFKAAGIPLS